MQCDAAGWWWLELRRKLTQIRCMNHAPVREAMSREAACWASEGGAKPKAVLGKVRGR
jgi:hypothetical protein